VTHARAIAAWWVALFFFWLLLVGQWNRVELIAAATAALLAACVAEIGRAHAGVAMRVPFGMLKELATVPFIVVADFGLLVWALPRRPQGTFRTKTFRQSSQGARAFAGLIATYSPNAYVVDFDPTQKTVLVHDLIPWPQSESPA
jgi:multisubunit Na+/H+ antiporter MnhE subunit